MDLLTQIQIGVVTLPQELQDSMAELTNIPLSVQEAHALSQLAQTGFVGFQSITNPLTPVGLNDELVPFLDSASEAIQLAQEFYTKIRAIDTAIQLIPQTGNRTTTSPTSPNTNTSDNLFDFDFELQRAIDEYHLSTNELVDAEDKSLDIRKKIKLIIEKGVDIFTEPLAVQTSSTFQMPSTSLLFSSDTPKDSPKLSSQESIVQPGGLDIKAVVKDDDEVDLAFSDDDENGK